MLYTTERLAKFLETGDVSLFTRSTWEFYIDSTSYGQPVSHLLSQHSSWQENTLKQRSVIKTKNYQKAFFIPAAALNFALTDFILDYIG